MSRTSSWVSISSSIGKTGVRASDRTRMQSLEREGWTVGESHTYDRPGQRYSRDFVLANRKYPELSVKIVYLPASGPGTPAFTFNM